MLDTFVSIRRYHLVTEGESAHNEESRQEPYRTNNRFESRSKDGILLMGSRALTVDRASFPWSSILPPSPPNSPFLSRSVFLFLCEDSDSAVVLTPDTHERPAKQVTVVLEIKAMQLRGRRENYSGNVFN